MTMKRAFAALERATGSSPAMAEPADGAKGTNGAGGTDPSRFLRGLAIGALVGAAIAGSTIWQRRRVRRRIRHELPAPRD